MLKKIGTFGATRHRRNDGNEGVSGVIRESESGLRESPEFVEGLDWRRQLEALTGER